MCLAMSRLFLDVGGPVRKRCIISFTVAPAYAPYCGNGGEPLATKLRRIYQQLQDGGRRSHLRNSELSKNEGPIPLEKYLLMGEIFPQPQVILFRIRSYDRSKPRVQLQSPIYFTFINHLACPHTTAGPPAHVLLPICPSTLSPKVGSPTVFEPRAILHTHRQFRLTCENMPRFDALP